MSTFNGLLDGCRVCERRGFDGVTAHTRDVLELGPVQVKTQRSGSSTPRSYRRTLRFSGTFRAPYVTMAPTKAIPGWPWEYVAGSATNWAPDAKGRISVPGTRAEIQLTPDDAAALSVWLDQHMERSGGLGEVPELSVGSPTKVFLGSIALIGLAHWWDKRARAKEQAAVKAAERAEET